MVLTALCICALGIAAALSLGSVSAADQTTSGTTTAAGCVGDCVPRSALVASEARSHRRLAGWNRANRRLIAVRAKLRVRWQPTVFGAIHLASAVYGIPESKMRAVSFCESRWDPFARNGKYLGLFQLGWSPFGLSPFDPYANALSAAQTVAHDGSWRQWSCG